MNGQANDYWDYPNRMQRQARRIAHRHLQAIPEAVISITANQPPDHGRLPHDKVQQLHAKIDSWRGQDFWRNDDLAAKASYLRRRRHVMTRDSVELLILAAFTQGYHGILEDVHPLYMGIYLDKLKGLAALPDDGSHLTTWSFHDMMFVTGVTLATLMYVEAAHRARIMARLVNSHGPDMPQHLVQRQLAAAQNALLRKSPHKDNWTGILDTIMTSVVGCAMLVAAKIGGHKAFTFHAIMDDRVTQVCEALDGKTFPVEEMKLYVNVPPIISEVPHPCRSYVTFNKNPESYVVQTEAAGIEDGGGKDRVRYEKPNPGDRHYREYLQMLAQTDSQLKKSAKNYSKKLELHKEKLAKPELHDKKWSIKDDVAKAGLLRYWNKEVEGLQIKLRWAEGILRERGF